MELAMARPRPAPSGCSVARWNRSNSRSRSSAGIPGPLSSTARVTRLARWRTLIRTVPSGPAYRQALSTRTPARRSIHSGGALIQAGSGPSQATWISMACERATARNRSAQLAAIVARSRGSLPGGGGCESNLASHSRSSTMWRSRSLSPWMRTSADR